MNDVQIVLRAREGNLKKVVKLCETSDRAFEPVRRARFVRRTASETQSVAPNVVLLLIRARYYDPMTGEFTSRDPLEYVDGMSLYRGYFVPGGMDPMGAIVINVVEDTLDEFACNSNGKIRWTFTPNSGPNGGAPCDGWLVQRVEVRCEINECEDCPDSSPTDPTFVFYEAWEFKEGETKDVNWNDDEPFTDESASPEAAKTCGNKTAKGELRYYCSNDHVSLVGLRLSWRTGRHGDGPCTTYTGHLPGHDEAYGVPEFWNMKPIEGPVFRSVGYFWNCCDGCESADAFSKP